MKFFLLLLTVLICSCSSDTRNDGTKKALTIHTSNTSNFHYRPITPADISAVQRQWQSRDLSPKKVEIVLTKVEQNYTTTIIKHKVLGNTHYTAVIVPNAFDASFPVVLMADGLNQQNPSLNLDFLLGWFNSSPPLNQFIQVYPSFRGRILMYQGLTFFSEGDFADAYDGATDDTIAALNVAQTMFPIGRYDKVAIWGGSRGGNTGLLAAARDHRINTVLAAAAPVDFYRQDVRENYNIQYQWQFFDGKNEDESRQRMLASSPIYFRPLKTVEKVILFHGANDTLVPRWNIDEMTRYLKSLNTNVVSHVYPNDDHTSFYGKAEHIENFSMHLQSFSQSINHIQ